MTAGLDLGSSEFRSLRRQDRRLIARRIPAVYTVVDDTPAQRRLLDQSSVPYSVTAGSLVVIGEPAIEVASLLSRPLVPVFSHGHLPNQDPVTRQVCAWMIDALLPPGDHNSGPCCLVLPRGETPGHGADSATAQFLEHVVRLRGYQTEIMQPACALALAELEDQEFTGACLTVGAESITFALTHLTKPIVEGRCATGSRSLIERFAHARKRYLWDHAGNAYVDLPSIQNWLYRGDISLGHPVNSDDAWLSDAYEELLLSAWFSLKRKILNSPHPLVHERVPLVVSGGACRLPGFLDLVAESLKLSGIPLHISEVRSATFDPYSIARGLLIKATLAVGEELPRLAPLEAA